MIEKGGKEREEGLKGEGREGREGGRKHGRYNQTQNERKEGNGKNRRKGKIEGMTELLNERKNKYRKRRKLQNYIIPFTSQTITLPTINTAFTVTQSVRQEFCHSVVQIGR